MYAPLSTVPTPRTASSTGRRLGRGLALAGAVGLLATIAGQLPASAAPGETSAGTTTANVGVESSITLQGLTTAFTLNGLPGDTVSLAKAVSYTVQTNNVGGYTVGVTAADDVLSPIGDSADTIPIANLKVRAGDPTDSSAYTSLSNTGAVTLRDQDTRSAAAGDKYSDDYQVDIPFVADDTYQVTLNYVATAS
jgi:hypothetical protein